MNQTDRPEFVIDAAGWCEQAQQLPSPNCDPRPPGAVIDLLLVHNISLPPEQFGTHYIEALFLDRLDCDVHPYFDRLRGMRVSAHFLISRDGSLLQFVSAHDRAWHAGVSLFEERERCNDFSIGVELEGSDFQPFAAAQYTALAALTAALQQRYPLRCVAGHEHVAPGRKTDPGPFFDWHRLRAMLQVRESNDPAAIAPLANLRFPIDA